jgi:CheY-like chemotaxis protein
MVLLEAVREDISEAASGSVALIYAVPPKGFEDVFDKQVRDRTLLDAYGLFKLNLRRIDAVGFYGPTTLLIYLPRLKRSQARSTLNSLRKSFVAERSDRNIAIGIASFPYDSGDVEELIELAEASARKGSQFAYVQPIDSPRKEEFEDTNEVSVLGPILASVRPVPLDVVQVDKEDSVGLKSDSVNGDPELDHSSLQSEPAPIKEDPVVTPPIETSVFAPMQAESVNFEPKSIEEPKSIPAAESSSFNAFVDDNKSHVVRETRRNEPEGLVSHVTKVRGTMAVKDMDASRAAAERATARERERRKRGARIPLRLLLTVSDAARMAQLNALVRSAGYEARTAFDGQQALDLLRIESPDVLLLDFELRGIDGLEMLRRLYKQSKGKLTVPVVMLLPLSKVTARREALELGASSIVAMPYDPDELLDSVRLAGNAE